MRSVEELQRSLGETCAQLGLARLELETAGKASTALAMEPSELRFPIERGGIQLGCFLLELPAGRRHLLQEEELVLTYLAEFIADALEQIAGRSVTARSLPAIPSALEPAV